MGKPKTFGQYVMMARQSKGYSDRQLAKRVGKVHTTISRIEAGSVPTPELFIALIDALELDLITAVKLVEPYRRLYERILAAVGGDRDSSK